MHRTLKSYENAHVKREITQKTRRTTTEEKNVQSDKRRATDKDPYVNFTEY